MQTGERPRILLIEDESAIADTVVYALRTEGFDPEWQATAADGLHALDRCEPALIILDVGLPDASGFDVCRQIRRQRQTPVLFLTARAEEVDRVVGLELGADDYVVKPFSPRELTARVRAILRRNPSGAMTARQQAPSLSLFTVDESRLSIHYCGAPLQLTRYEYRLLKTLIAHPGRVYTREQLLQLAWDHPEHRLDRTVDTHIKTLRAKLQAVDPARDPIRTHRGIGYSLDENA
jgi:two-component system, OmpR family, catabolic regulation response regulator CreB